MFNAFTALPKEARAEHLAASRSYLGARAGDPDVGRRQLSRREALMGRYSSFRSDRTLDKELSDKHNQESDPQVPTSPEMLLWPALVKINAAEAFGVNAHFATALARAVKALEDGNDDIDLTLLVEESYHTRILLSTASIYGFEIEQPFVPPFSLRTLIAMLGSVPPTLSRPLVLASELLGTVAFMGLFVRAGEVLRDQPEIRDAVEERIIEVLVDEVGHVTFNRLCLGSFGLSQARALLPMVAMGMKNVIPEMNVLGAKFTSDTSILKRMPEEVKRAAFVV